MQVVGFISVNSAFKRLGYKFKSLFKNDNTERYVLISIDIHANLKLMLLSCFVY